MDRWEEELLDDLTTTVPLPVDFRVAFTHARKVRVAEIGLGWLKIRLPGKQQVLWALVAYEPSLDRTLVLITNIPIHTAQDAQAVYTEWRYRPQIEHTYRFDQEDGLDVEDVRVQTMERMRRIFVLIMIAALFVYHIAHAWPQHMVLWLRRLGGKLGLSSSLMAPMSFSPASELSWSPSLPWRLLHNIPSPAREEGHGHLGNHQVDCIDGNLTNPLTEPF